MYYVVKTKALISLTVTAKLICFVFAYAKSPFSHDKAQMEGKDYKIKAIKLLQTSRPKEKIAHLRASNSCYKNMSLVMRKPVLIVSEQV